MSEREPAARQRTVLISWLGVLALGIWLFFEGLEARGEQLETRRLVQELHERKDGLQHDEGRVRHEIEQIDKDDPAAIKGGLQPLGWIEKDRVAVDKARKH